MIESPRAIPGSLELRLAKLIRFTAKAVDEQNKPIAGAKIIASFRRAGNLPLRLDLPY